MGLNKSIVGASEAVKGVWQVEAVEMGVVPKRVAGCRMQDAANMEAWRQRQRQKQKRGIFFTASVHPLHGNRYKHISRLVQAPPSNQLWVHPNKICKFPSFQSHQ